MFVAGGTAGKLLLNKKGWLLDDEIVLHKGEGSVSSIAWRCEGRAQEAFFVITVKGKREDGRDMHCPKLPHDGDTCGNT